ARPLLSPARPTMFGAASSIGPNDPGVVHVLATIGPAAGARNPLGLRAVGRAGIRPGAPAALPEGQRRRPGDAGRDAQARPSRKGPSRRPPGRPGGSGRAARPGWGPRGHGAVVGGRPQEEPGRPPGPAPTRPRDPGAGAAGDPARRRHED